jgi:hypothetical protein
MQALKAVKAIGNIESKTTPGHIEDQTSWHHKSECQLFRCAEEVRLLFASRVAICVDGEGLSIESCRLPLLA